MMDSDYFSQLNRILDGNIEPGQVRQTLPYPNEINGSSTSVVSVSASTHSLGTSSSRSSSVASSQLPRQGGVGDSSAVTFSSSTNGLIGGEKTNVTAGGAATYVAGQAPSTEDAVPSASKLADCKTGQTPPHPVPEFLFQLTKMLTDDNLEYIEWKKATIYVHDPPGLEKNLLPRYFRHSNYSSFQRQMNYFGFRKIAGKGKMAPCSYVNEHAKEDISSLLYIKRKKSRVSSTAARLISQQNRLANSIIPGAKPAVMSVPGVMMQQAPVSNFGNISQFALSGSSIPISHQMPGVYQPTLQEQMILAQLQQAHTSAASAAGLGLPQYVQCAPMMANLNQGLLTADQGQLLYPGSLPENKTNSLATTLSIQQQQQQEQQVSVSQSMVKNSDPNVFDLGVGSSERALLTQQMSAFNPAMQVQAANNLSPQATANYGQVAAGAASALYGSQGLQLGPARSQQQTLEEILRNA